MISAECVRRVEHAWRLHGPGDVVVFSGAGECPIVEGCRCWPSEAMQMAGYWATGAHPYVLEERSRTTRENAEFCAALLRGLRVDRVVVVTSFWHAPRAWWCWHGRGLKVRVSPSPGSVRYVPGEVRAWLRLLFSR